MEWDPFEDVDLDDADDPAVLRERALAHAAALDRGMAMCLGCHRPSRDWITRRGLTGDGVCRECMVAQDIERAAARAFTRSFHQALVTLRRLRKERDERIAMDVADVPF